MANHLLESVRMGLPLHLDVLGINESLIEAVLDGVRKNDSGKKAHEVI